MGFLSSLFGGSKSTRSTVPLTPGQLEDYYRAALGLTGPEPTTELPAFQWERLTGGDYDRLEEELASTPLRRLSEERTAARARYMDRLRRLGIADEPAADKLLGEFVDRPYRESMSDILSKAASSRYGLQLRELGEMNPARLTHGLERYTRPRQHWLDKMRTYYLGQSPITTERTRSSGGIISGLGGLTGIGKGIASVGELFRKGG